MSDKKPSIQERRVYCLIRLLMEELPMPKIHTLLQDARMWAATEDFHGREGLSSGLYENRAEELLRYFWGKKEE